MTFLYMYIGHTHTHTHTPIHYSLLSTSCLIPLLVFAQAYTYTHACMHLRMCLKLDPVSFFKFANRSMCEGFLQ